MDTLDLNRHTLKGILICPLNAGYVEFEYCDGDIVAELRQRIREVWGEPGGVQNTNYWHKNRWAVFCKCADGTYTMLIDSDPIPASAPKSCADLDSVHAGWAKQPLREILAGELRRDDATCDGILDDVLQRSHLWKARRVEKSQSEAEVMGSVSYEEILAGDYRQMKILRPSSVPNQVYSVELLALVAVVGG